MGNYYYLNNSNQKLELIWIDANINNDENNNYKNKIKKIMEAKLSCFDNIQKAFEYLKNIEFIPVCIMCSGKLYPEFIKEFRNKIREFSICPKIIIFCGNKKSYIERNKNDPDLCLNHPFYNSGGVQDNFDDVKNFLLKQDEKTTQNESYQIMEVFEDKFNFEYISDKNQLILPLFFSKYLKNPSENEIHNFNEIMEKNYYSINELGMIFSQLKDVKSIPYEILYKFWMKAFSFGIDFYLNINEQLKENISYSTLIAGIYKGFEIFQNEKFPLENPKDNCLFKYTYFSKEKIDNMQTILSNKKENLPPILLYSKDFLVFYLNKKEAKKNDQNSNSNCELIIENAYKNLEFCSGYESLEKFNIKKKEILFFPYNFFEVLKIEKVKDNYILYLGFIGKYKDLLFKEEDYKLLADNIPENSNITKEFFNNNLIDDFYKDVYNIITIKYQPSKSNKSIKLFGKKFIEKNKDNCYMIYEGKKSEIKEKLILDDKKRNSTEITIKLAGLNKIDDISHLFEKINSLISLPNISKIDTSKIKNMSCMFKFCSNLKNLSDISKWNTKNVTDMSHLFAKCSSLVKLPDISKWNTSKVTNMSYMFDSCNSLTNLPNISKWNVDSLTDMSFMFYDLLNLKTFPDISKWNTSLVKDMGSLFEKCSQITNLPDISIWNTENVNDMSYMFFMCKSLKSLPDISKWNIKNVTHFEYMFDGLDQSIKIPEQFKK